MTETKPHPLERAADLLLRDGHYDASIDCRAAAEKLERQRRAIGGLEANIERQAARIIELEALVPEEPAA